MDNFDRKLDEAFALGSNGVNIESWINDLHDLNIVDLYEMIKKAELDGFKAAFLDSNPSIGIEEPLLVWYSGEGSPEAIATAWLEKMKQMKQLGY
jgi:hypothetical protein